MEWKNVKQGELPICNKKWFVIDDDVSLMASERVLVVVNQLRSNNQYITFGRMDEYKDWTIGDYDENLNNSNEITHWMPFPELPRA